MRTTTTLFAILLLAFSLAAQANSVRIGNRLITEGDSIGTVRQVAGAPKRAGSIDWRSASAPRESDQFPMHSRTKSCTSPV